MPWVGSANCRFLPGSKARKPNARRLDRGRGVVAGDGAEGDRTLNLLDATEALSQLSYRPAEPNILAFKQPTCHAFAASERYTVSRLFFLDFRHWE